MTIEQAIAHSLSKPWGVVDPPLQVVVSVAFPVIMAVYLGVAEAARHRTQPRARSVP